MQQELWIPGVFPSLNDLIEAAKNEIRQASYSRMKRAQTTRVALRASRLVPMSSAHVTLHHHRTNKRTDPDNIVAAAQKFVLDGLQRADVLPGDGWAAVLSLTNVFLVDKDNPGTLVVLVGEKAEHGIEKKGGRRAPRGRANPARAGKAVVAGTHARDAVPARQDARDGATVGRRDKDTRGKAGGPVR